MTKRGKANDLRRSPHSVYNIKAHLILVTAYRRRVITADIMVELENKTRELCGNHDVEVLEFSGEPDHIHVLLDLTHAITPSKLVNSIKTVTSRMIRRSHRDHVKKYLWGGRFWSRSYCMISVGDGATTEIIRKYISNQNRPRS